MLEKIELYIYHIIQGSVSEKLGNTGNKLTSSYITYKDVATSDCLSTCLRFICQNIMITIEYRSTYIILLKF